MGERCLKEYREGRNCTGKRVSELGSLKVLSGFPASEDVPMFKFLGNLIQPLMG